MLESQRARLLREDGWTAQGLAEELYAMFQNDIDPLEVGSGIRFTGPPGNAYFDFGDVPSFDTPLFSGRRDGEDFSFTLNNIEDGAARRPEQPPAASAFPGQLVAYSGGNTYTVKVYEQGLAGGFNTVSAKQLFGDATRPHAVDGTVWAIVTKTGSTYSMMVPVWG